MAAAPVNPRADAPQPVVLGVDLSARPDITWIGVRDSRGRVHALPPACTDTLLSVWRCQPPPIAFPPERLPPLTLRGERP